MRPAGRSVCRRTICSGCATGSERSITESIRLKMAVFAPMPSAKVSTPIMVKPGRLIRLLIPWRRSFRMLSINSPEQVFGLWSRSDMLQLVDYLRQSLHRSPRQAESCRTSFISERHQRIDFRRATSRDVAGEQRDAGQQDSKTGERKGISRTYAV